MSLLSTGVILYVVFVTLLGLFDSANTKSGSLPPNETLSTSCLASNEILALQAGGIVSDQASGRRIDIPAQLTVTSPDGKYVHNQKLAYARYFIPVNPPGNYVATVTSLERG